MTARAGARLAAATAALALVGCGPAPIEARTVLFVSIDTARADVVRFDDPSTTPVMSALARRGVVFDEALTGTSWTLPSHVQMFTGQPPVLHGVNFDDVEIDPRTPTLAELFSEAGWFTAGFFSGWYLIGDYGFSRGFDIYENAMPGGAAFERELRDAHRVRDPKARADAMAKVWDRADAQSHEAVSSPEVVERAIGAIDQAGEEDLFLFLHFFDPHYDYVPPDELVERFDPGYEGTIDGRNFYHNRRIFDPERGGRQISDRDLQHVRALYRGEVYFTDQHVGRVLDHLERRGRLDGTMVVVVGDHGEEFFEHGNRGHRATLFDEQLRVPMLFVPPKDLEAARGRTVRAQTSLSDVAPTLLEYADLPRDHCQGRSLLGAVRGGELESRAETSFLKPFPNIRLEGRGAERHVAAVRHVYLEGWRTPDEKFLRSFVYRVEEGLLVPKDAMYVDLASDPGEQRPITDPSDGRLAAAWERMEELNAGLRELHASGDRAPVEQRVAAAKDMLSGALQEMGYVADSGEVVEDEGVPSASYQVPWGLAPPPSLPLSLYLEELGRR